MYRKKVRRLIYTLMVGLPVITGAALVGVAKVMRMEEANSCIYLQRGDVIGGDLRENYYYRFRKQPPFPGEELTLDAILQRCSELGIDVTRRAAQQAIRRTLEDGIDLPSTLLTSALDFKEINKPE